MARIGKPCVRVVTPMPPELLDVGMVDCYSIWPEIAAELFAQGRVTNTGSASNAVMHDVVFALTRSGEFPTDEICASAALYLAEVKVPKARMTKDGFAYGIKRRSETHRVPVTVNGRAYDLLVVDSSGRRRRSGTTRVGVLREG